MASVIFRNRRLDSAAAERTEQDQTSGSHQDLEIEPERLFPGILQSQGVLLREDPLPIHAIGIFASNMFL
jgi:hypothetical protein